ncbi:MAG: RNA polymerase factor sigma-54 [Phycisphaerae bacterium]|nr:RNA polymerase factor sigma-54 [Phycisphaerae bacterium]
MRLDQTQHLGLRQEMKLAPRIIQAMEILQLPLLALQERIDAELVSNPVLEVAEGGEGESAEAAFERDYDEGQLVVDGNHGNREDFSRLDEMTRQFGPDFANDDAPYSRRGDSGEPDAKLEAMANAPGPGLTLEEYLREQWVFVEASPAVLAAGEVILGVIDVDGYLRIPLERLAAEAAGTNPDVTVEALRQALSLVQGLDPTGVAARDLRECLLLQLHALAGAGRDVHLETQIVENFLREVEMNRLPAVAKRLGCSLEDVKTAIGNISRLDPRPGLRIGGQAAPVIHPDVIVLVDDDGQVVVVSADEYLPNLSISEYYANQARDRNTDTKTRQFLRRNIRSAQWILEAIAQRRQTIRRVTEEVFKVQREFLDAGPEALKPLPMADVAGRVGVHVATVSRAVADKYVQTPRGVFPLRMFFSGGTKTADGEDMSWDAVRVKLREIVDNEDKSNPLNDDELAKALNEAGIDIARRTVAKYRGLMDIPPARKRKEY